MDSALADDELVRDLRVAHPVGDKAQCLDLPRCQSGTTHSFRMIFHLGLAAFLSAACCEAKRDGDPGGERLCEAPAVTAFHGSSAGMQSTGRPSA